MSEEIVERRCGCYDALVVKRAKTLSKNEVL